MKPETARKPKSNKTQTERDWSSLMFRLGCTGGTFSQAAGILWEKTGVSAHGNSECHPKPDHGSPDWAKKIADVYPNFNRKAKVRA